MYQLIYQLNSAMIKYCRSSSLVWLTAQPHPICTLSSSLFAKQKNYLPAQYSPKSVKWNGTDLNLLSPEIHLVLIEKHFCFCQAYTGTNPLFTFA